jgi:glycosyltransferase involved in cell wall biosynthesis
MLNWIGLTWSISNRFGWGVYGLNLVLELLKRGQPIPVCLDVITTDTLPPNTVETLKPVIDFQRENLKHMHRTGQVATLKNTLLLHAMGNNLDWSLLSHSFVGDANIGVIFFEYTDFSPEAEERAKRLDAIVAGSTWNGQVLQDQGFENIRTVFQGIDTKLFRPMARKGEYAGKFVVFSGGKLDFRKGQDIVLAAFKRFSERHDDAILVTAWQNLWPLTALPMVHSPHSDTLPRVDVSGTLKLTEWAAANGIPQDKFVDLGMLPNERMPDILKEFDLAVFPNRCEGGTNLVAMETMACGVPCVIAANTGQMDLIRDDNCYALSDQSPVEFPNAGVAGWGESSVDELVEAMEYAYQNRDDAKRRGQAAADFMRGWSWSGQIGKLLDTLEEFC